MHEANEVVDGLWKIRQSAEDKRICLYYCGELVATTYRDTLLQFEELRWLLITMRNDVRSEEE